MLPLTPGMASLLLGGGTIAATAGGHKGSDEKRVLHPVTREGFHKVRRTHTIAWHAALCVNVTLNHLKAWRPRTCVPSPWHGARLGTQLRTNALLLLIRLLRHHHDLDLGGDLIAQAQLDLV